MRTFRIPLGAVCISVLTLFGVGCHDSELDLGAEFTAILPDGKLDGAGRGGLAVSTDTSTTDVWTVRNQWEDRDTPEAKQAGLAWTADSKLSWDEKYAAWVKSLVKIPGVSYGDTYELTTPFGQKIPSPSLECAESAIFLRVAFASFYGLPFFLEAQTGGQRVYFGHFGVRTANGAWPSAPAFATKYRDYTATWKDGQAWPTDGKLHKAQLDGSHDTSNQSDVQPMLTPNDQHFGAYVDTLFLNKRVGYLMILLLDNFGSMNLADSANTYNLRPEAVREGDSLLERSQRLGIGHTLVVKSVGIIASTGATMVNLMSGSMPRRQPEWEDEVASKSYFIIDQTGGIGDSGDVPPVAYWKLGGGLKRWRVAKNVKGFWTNTWMTADESNWIDSSDGARISARPARFQSFLGEVPAPEKRDALLKQIDDLRHHLSQYPASCSARDERDKAFSSLIDLADKLGTTPNEMIPKYRKLEDYVFAPLEYAQSKTCCWDTTTAEMYQIIMDYAAEEQTNAKACIAPTVFRSQKDGYGVWKAYAAKTGRAGQWREWSEDEPCTARAVAEDTATSSWTRRGEWCADFTPTVVDFGGTDDGGSDEGSDGGVVKTGEVDGGVSPDLAMP